jgi:hypothetical protein
MDLINNKLKTSESSGTCVKEKTNLGERDYLEDLGVDGKVLKWMFCKYT